MRKIVLKFGGTSLKDNASRDLVVQIIREASLECDYLIVVVSAMGRKGAPYATDTLLDLFSKGKKLPNNREQDLIYCCGEIISACILSQELKEIGFQNVALTGGQAGILTDSNYTEANIITLQNEKLEQRLIETPIVILAGGQGVADNGDLTTLGRGGSDTTACAVGYYTKADEVRIYTDVDGIYSGDPNVIKKAFKIPVISFEQCYKLANYGLQIIHPKAVQYSEKGMKTALCIRSTFTKTSGTYIRKEASDQTAITYFRNLYIIAISKNEKDVFAASLAKRAIKPRLVLDGDRNTYFCLEPHKEHFESLPPGKLNDVIFIVGPDAKVDKVAHHLLNTTESKMINLNNDCVAVTVKSSFFQEQINILHDEICLV